MCHFVCCGIMIQRCTLAGYYIDANIKGSRCTIYFSEATANSFIKIISFLNTKNIVLLFSALKDA